MLAEVQVAQLQTFVLAIQLAQKVSFAFMLMEHVGLALKELAQIFLKSAQENLDLFVAVIRRHIQIAVGLTLLLYLCFQKGAAKVKTSHKKKAAWFPRQPF